MTTALLVAAFLMGFFGSPHCLGMCGGIVTAFGLSMKDTSPAKKRGLVATYHFGRLLSYALLGLIAGVIGTTVLTPLMVGNNTPRILLGLVLAFVGLTMLGLPFLNKLERLGMHFWQALAPLRKSISFKYVSSRINGRFALGFFALWSCLWCIIDSCRGSQPVDRCRSNVCIWTWNHSHAGRYS